MLPPRFVWAKVLNWKHQALGFDTWIGGESDLTDLIA